MKYRKQIIVVIVLLISAVAAGSYVLGNKEIIDIHDFRNEVSSIIASNQNTTMKWQYIMSGEDEEAFNDVQAASTRKRRRNENIEDKTSSADANHNNGNVDVQGEEEPPKETEKEPDYEVDPPLDVDEGNNLPSPEINLCTPVYARKLKEIGEEYVAQYEMFQNYAGRERAATQLPEYEDFELYFRTYGQIGENLIKFAENVDKGNYDLALTYLDTVIALNESIPAIY